MLELPIQSAFRGSCKTAQKNYFPKKKLKIGVNGKKIYSPVFQCGLNNNTLEVILAFRGFCKTAQKNYFPKKKLKMGLNGKKVYSPVFQCGLNNNKFLK